MEPTPARRLSIVLYVPGMPFDGDTIKDKSLGGSETAGLCLARALAAKGQRVYVFCNCPRPGVYDGVTYHPAEGFAPFALANPHDVLIIQRSPEALAARTAARLNILWQHDLPLARNTPRHNGVLWNVDRIAVVSDWMADRYREVYDIDPELLFTARNGIDLGDFAGLDVLEREPGKLMFAGRPERGLDVLLERVMPRILAERPDVRLHIAGYDNQVQQLAPFYQRINAAMEALGDRVVWLGYLSKRELYRHYATAQAYVYPTPSPFMPEFAEVSCISAMESMAAGLPFMSVARGALPETLAGGAGVLVEDGPPDEVAMRIAAETLALLSDPHARERMANNGRAAAYFATWDARADDWLAMIEAEFAKHNDDPIRLARHLLRRSDVIAARAALGEVVVRDEAELEEAAGLLTRIDRGYAFALTRNAEAFTRHYAEAHAETVVGLGGWDAANREPRVERCAAFLNAQLRSQVYDNTRPLSDQPLRVLDMGCGPHGHTTALSNRVPGAEFTGCDLAPACVEGSIECRAKHAADPTRVRLLYAGIHALDPDAAAHWAGSRAGEVGDGYDVAMAMEVLEHVPAPWRFIDALESRVRPGGRVYLTVPYGPWEEASFDTTTFRQHLWEYEPQDLDDMLGHKPGLTIESVPCARSQISHVPLGHYEVSYIADHRPACPIDMVRKLAIQRPRQTVSATLMVGGPTAEETLAWCLRSIRPVIDELVIADTGMTAGARRIAAEFGARIVPSPSPIEAGFEAPRNAALAAARCDWVLWIDSDERLLETQNLDKYLRANCFSGYGIRQHHFAVDAQFQPDMPVRLFRRAGHKGKPIRFWGMIHEHPEMEVNAGPGPIVVLSDVHIGHVGYLTESTRRRRFERNLPMLRRDMERYPERKLQKHFICRDNMLLVMHQLQINGGQVTPEIARLCEDTIAIYREHFLGAPTFVNVDPLQYYSQALRLLGRGFDVDFSIKVARDGQGDQLNGSAMRFESEADFLREVTARAERAAKPYARANW